MFMIVPRISPSPYSNQDPKDAILRALPILWLSQWLSPKTPEMPMKPFNCCYSSLLKTQFGKFDFLTRLWEV